jgi:hypothetical protein
MKEATLLSCRPSPKCCPLCGIEEVMGEFAPGLLKEMRTLAEAAGVDYDALATISITAPLNQTGFPSCTVFAPSHRRVPSLAA